LKQAALACQRPVFGTEGVAAALLADRDC